MLAPVPELRPPPGRLPADGGTGFDMTMDYGVLFGLQAATDVRANGPFSISCTTPPGAAASQSVDVTVISENGDRCVGVGVYMYDPPPTCDTQCTINSVDPTQGPLAGQTRMFIDRTDFCPGQMEVWFGSNRATGGVSTKTPPSA